MGLSHLELRLLLSHLLFGKAEAWKFTFNFYDFSLQLLSYSSNGMRSLPMKNLEWEVYFEFPSSPLMVQSSAWALNQGHALSQPCRTGSWSWTNVHTRGTAALPRLSHSASAAASQLPDL